MLIKNIIENYKPLIAIPIIITLIMLFILTFNGLKQGIDLNGGTIVDLNLEKQIDQDQLETLLNSLNTGEIRINSFNNKTATVTMEKNIDINTLQNTLTSIASITSYKSVGPVLSAQALKQVYWAVIIAFLFMSLTVFLIFRRFIPSIAVILAVFCDIIISMGGMSLFNIPLSMASVGALLLLIGYSVDTDILLTTRVLKRRNGTITERALKAIKTGLTMAIAAIGAMSALLIVTTYLIPSAETLSHIAAVLIIGLIADILVTWLMNLGILRAYMERAHT